MSYAEILKEYISKSGKTLDQIASECEERGVTIHSTYISKLRLGQRPAPPDSTSRVLAEVTNGDPDKLISAGYIERAPEEVRGIIAHYLNHFDSYITHVAMFFIDSDGKSEEVYLEEVREMIDKINEIPFEERIDFVINHYNRVIFAQPEYLKEIGEISGIPSDKVHFTLKTIQESPLNRIRILNLENGEESEEWASTSKIRFGEFLYLITADDSMIGAGITKGAKLFCQVDGAEFLDNETRKVVVKSGKIYAVSYKNEIIIRRVFQPEGSDTLILQSENPKFPPITITDENDDDFKWFGIIKSVEFNLD